VYRHQYGCTLKGNEKNFRLEKISKTLFGVWDFFVVAGKNILGRKNIGPFQKNILAQNFFVDWKQYWA
jgi:hypothetical protein